jgi:hypothetical protein
VPLEPEVIVSQLRLSLVVQLHPLGAVTLTLPVPPDEVNVLLVGEML